QATFLVLARRASSVQPPELVGSWLHGVARNTARKLKVQNHRRRAREREAAAQAQRETPAGTRPRPEELLDEGLQALPEKYRAVIVLCDLEGRSLREAAQLLSCPVGTVGTPLARGRRLLARRLGGRCSAWSAGALAAVLTRGGLKAMLLNNWKI